MTIHESDTFTVEGKTIKFVDPTGHYHYFILDEEQMETIAHYLLDTYNRRKELRR